MTITKKTEVTQANCDSCGKDLICVLGETTRNVNYADIVPSFGYGSDLDPMGGTINPRYHLCEECFAKAMHAINLPVHDLDPVICPVCRKPRQGQDDHPACMENWYPHPNSKPQRELREAMDAREKEHKDIKERGGQ